MSLAARPCPWDSRGTDRPLRPVSSQIHRTREQSAILLSAASLGAQPALPLPDLCAEAEAGSAPGEKRGHTGHAPRRSPPRPAGAPPLPAPPPALPPAPRPPPASPPASEAPGSPGGAAEGAGWPAHGDVAGLFVHCGRIRAWASGRGCAQLSPLGSCSHDGSLRVEPL